MTSNSSQQLNDQKKKKVSNTSYTLFGLIFSRLKKLLKWISIIVILVFIIIPFIFRYSLTIRRLFVFMNYFNIPLFKNLSAKQLSNQLYTKSLHWNQWINAFRHLACVSTKPSFSIFTEAVVPEVMNIDYNCIKCWLIINNWTLMWSLLTIEYMEIQLMLCRQRV